MVGRVTSVQPHRDKTRTVSIRIGPDMPAPREGGICVMQDPITLERAVLLPADPRHDLAVLRWLPAEKERAVTCAELHARIPRIGGQTIAGCLLRLRNKQLVAVANDPRRPLRYYRTQQGNNVHELFRDVWDVLGKSPRAEIDRLYAEMREENRNKQAG